MAGTNIQKKTYVNIRGCSFIVYYKFGVQADPSTPPELPLCNIVINSGDPPLCNIVINREDPPPHFVLRNIWTAPNWFLDSCLSWNWTISCALFAIEKLTLELFSIILGLKIWSCNFFQRLRFTVSPYTCYWKFCCFDITNRESLWMFSNSESSSLVLWFSGSLVLWFILVLQNCL